MKDTLALLAAADRLLAAHEEAVLVTLIHTQGSTYRRPGARMLVLPGNRTVGTISGGCLEPAVARQAWSLTRTTPRAAFTFESTPEDDTWGPASGCHGTLTLLAERISATNPLLPGQHHPALKQLAAVCATHQPSLLTHLVARHADGTLLTDQSSPTPTPAENTRWEREVDIARANQASRWVELDTTAAFLEYLAPPAHILLCGAGDDAQPVARMAAELAWTVDLLDSRARLATADRFPTARRISHALDSLAQYLYPHTAVVLMTHRFADDLVILAQLLTLEAPARYIGILGPRRRTERLLSELITRGIAPSPRHLHSIRSPIGLDLGAAAPETIALSIIAEIQTTLSNRDAHPLSALNRAILAPSSAASTHR